MNSRFLPLGLALILSACSGGAGVRNSEAGRYSHRMHNRFYEAWVQPTTVGLPRGKISVPIDVEIDLHGTIASFKIVRPSGNAAVDQSIAAVGRRIQHVAPPPGASAGKLFRLRIFFELDVR